MDGHNRSRDKYSTLRGCRMQAMQESSNNVLRCPQVDSDLALVSRTISILFHLIVRQIDEKSPYAQWHFQRNTRISFSGSGRGEIQRSMNCGQMSERASIDGSTKTRS